MANIHDRDRIGLNGTVPEQNVEDRDPDMLEDNRSMSFNLLHGR